MRTKPYRITVDLSPATCTALHCWLAFTAAAAGKPELTLSGAVPALIRSYVLQQL